MKKSEPVVATSSKIIFDDESISSEDEGEEIEKELAEVTFEELQRARSDGSDMVFRKRNADGKTRGRANKNRPMEMSSKKPVPRLREVIQVPKRVVRDPRFESLCGILNVDGFKKRYNFIYEKNLPSEKEELRKQMKKARDPEVKDELKERISRINKELKDAAPKRTEKNILAEHKKKEREAAKKGKRPYYLKNSEVRKEKLVEKYKELKESGKLEAFIEKKRRKNAAKDHRYMPYRRPTNDQENQPHRSNGTSRDWSVGAHEPYWRTNTSFSPPPSRWDLPFESEAVSFGSHDGFQLYGSSASSDSRESRIWVRGNNHQLLVSDGVGPYFSSPSDFSPAQQWTPPTRQEISNNDHGNSRREVVLRPISFSPTMEGASAARDSAGSTSSRSDSSGDYESMVKSHTSHRNFAAWKSKV